MRIWSRSRSSAFSDDSGPRVVSGSCGIPRLQRAQAFAESPQESLAPLLADHDDALGGDTALTGVEHPADQRAGDGVLQVGILQDNQGIAAAELHDGLLQAAAGAFGHRGSGALTSGDGDAGDPRVFDQPPDLVDAGEHVRVNPRRGASLLKEPRERQRAVRDVLGVLDDQDIAGHQLRSGDAGELVVGEVPGLDAEDHTDRLGFDHGSRRFWQLLGGEERLGAVGVVVEDRCRQADLCLRGSDQLAHLGGDVLRVLCRVGSQLGCGRLDDARAVCDRPVPPVVLVAGSGRVQGIIEVGVGDVPERPGRLAGRWVDSPIGHDAHFRR